MAKSKPKPAKVAERIAEILSGCNVGAIACPRKRCLDCKDRLTKELAELFNQLARAGEGRGK